MEQKREIEKTFSVFELLDKEFFNMMKTVNLETKNEDGVVEIERRVTVDADTDPHSPEILAEADRVLEKVKAFRNLPNEQRLETRVEQLEGVLRQILNLCPMTVSEWAEKSETERTLRREISHLADMALISTKIP